MDMCVQVCLYLGKMSFGHKPSSGGVGSYDNSIPSSEKAPG